jgi:WD40 repeat protein
MVKIMKLKFVFIIFLLAFITSVMTQALKATEIDTLWIRDLWRGHEEDIIKTLVSSDDSLIFVGYKKPAKIEVYNAINGDSIRTLTFPRSKSILNDFDISNDCKYVMACENGDTSTIIHVWDMKSGNHLRTIFENDTNFTSFRRFDFLSITPDSRYIFTSMGGKQYKDYKGDLHDSASRRFVIDTSNWQVKREINIEARGSFEHSPNNKFYVCSFTIESGIRSVELRDINNDTLISKFIDSSNVKYSYTGFRFSPDSNYLISQGGNDWYIWKIGQQNYYRKYPWDTRKSFIPLNFANESGKIASQKYDTLTKKFKTIFFDFINDILIKNFDFSSDEILFTKTSNKFIIRDFYTLILIDSTWNTSVFNNEEHHSDLLIMPNPASDFIEISYPPLERGSGGVDIRIYNVLGEIQTTPQWASPLLRNRDTPPWKGGEKVRIDVSGLVSGVYFVRFGYRVGKFVKI